MSFPAPARPAIELWSQELADALPMACTLIDDSGRIRRTNAAWDEFCLANGGTLEAVRPPANYLAACDAAADPAVREIKAGIAAVLAGESSRFEVEYPCHGPAVERWFRLTVTPLAGGALVLHTDITGEYQRVGRWTARSPLAVIELDRTLAAGWVNPYWAQLAGSPQRDLMNDAWIKPVLDDDRPTLMFSLRTAVATRQPQSVDVRVTRDDDQRRLRFRITPFVDDFDILRSVALIGIDITVEYALHHLQAAAEERRRLGADVHDTVIQRLFAAALVVNDAVEGHAEMDADSLRFVRDNVTDSMAKLRALMSDSERDQPVDLAAELHAACERGERMLGFTPQLGIDGDASSVPPDVARDVVAVVTEGLANTARHAQASHGDVRVVIDAARISVRITDDGRGMPARPGRASGTANITHRAERLGGRAAWDAAPGGGTVLTWTAPLR